MAGFARILLASSIGIFFSIAHPFSALSAQNPGEVLWQQKISATKGNGPHNLRVNDQFGRAAAALGDLDGDGICDFAVGALGDDDGSSDDSLQYGAVWILFMNRDGTVKSHYKISRTSAGLPLDPGDEWGRSVRELGDWDLDGVPDVMVGTSYDDDNGTDKGAFYLLFLNRDGSVKSWKKISELSGGFTGDLDSGDEFGRGLRVLGDLDLDGVPEIGVGSVHDDDGGTDRGAYWILFMRRDGTVRSWTKLSSKSGHLQSRLENYGEFGFDCCVIGDRNGDGIQDIALGSPDQKTDNLQQGAVFIVCLNRDGTSKQDFRIAENYSGFVGDMLDYNDEFGCCVDNLGDLDHDGNADIAVGAGKDDDGPSGSFDRGAMYVLFLNADATVKSWQKISRTAGRFYGGIDNGDRFGTSLACPGDITGDGLPDLLVGMRFDDDGGSGVGCEWFLSLNDGTFVPPLAKFTYTPNRGKAPLNVQFSDQSTGSVNSWAWDFGDGTTSTERNPLHAYTATGLKTVSLTVRGPAGSHQRILSNIIKVDLPLAPLASFDGTPLLGMAPLAVQFTNTSVGVVRSSSWDFGDGATSTETSPLHVYGTVGHYTVALTVANETGSKTLTRAAYVIATDVPPPSADFTLDVAAGLAPLAVQFTDASTGDVTAWQWNFGDGAASNSASPQHTYVAAGTFTVTLVAHGPGGQDSEIKTGLVTVTQPPPPVAAFTLDVTSGIDPLPVAFLDQSSGAVTSWSWSFGDGSLATTQNPAHTYIAPGVYTVALTAKGPGGSSQIVQSDLVTVQSVVRGLRDPSFEEQTAGAMPGAPWNVLAGIEHVVEPGTPGLLDAPFPLDGAQWLRISSAGTSHALPPTVPGGMTSPALGGAGVAQDFYLEDPLGVLEFDAAFVRGDLVDNDWMSIDVSDGPTTVNLYFADGTTPTPGLSLGVPRTALRHVSASLRTLFPSSVRNTRFTLTIQVGNAGENVTPSFGLVDKFHLEQALGTALRYGCDTVVRGTLSVLSGTPRVGATLTLGVDNRLGTQGANSRAYVWISRQPDAAYPCGTLLPNFGMAGPGAMGEILVNRTTGVLLKTTTGALWSKPGTPAAVPIVIPAAISWIGTPWYAQGYLIDGRATAPLRTAVTDAFKLLIGP